MDRILIVVVLFYISLQYLANDHVNPRTSDNYNQLILIDDIAGHLISCGNVYQGTCTARMLEDISFAVPDMESFYVENYVVATDHR